MKRMSVVLLVGAWLLVATGAHAQSLAVSGGLGVGQLWDDETMLGRGLDVSGGVSTGLGDHVRVAAEVDWLTHSRTLTYLGVDGHATGALGRMSYVFGAPASPVRPYAGLGVGLMHSTGTLKTPVVVIAPNGQPTLSTTVKESTDWSLTRSMWDAHAGLRIGAGRGLVLRPELRWRATFGSGASSGIEPPLLGVQGTVSLEWSRARR